MPEQGDVKIANLWKHKSSIVAAIGKYPAKRARALSTVLEREYGLFVKWKALQTYCLREQLWGGKQTLVASTSAQPRQEQSYGSSTAAGPCSTMTICKGKADLNEHHGRIRDAIARHPGKKSKALSAILEQNYLLQVAWHILKD